MSTSRTMSTDECVGALIARLAEFCQARQLWYQMGVYAGRTEVHIYNLDPELHPVRGELGGQIYVQHLSSSGTACMTARGATPLGALKIACAYLAFPPEIVGRHLNLVGGGQ